MTPFIPPLLPPPLPLLYTTDEIRATSDLIVTRVNKEKFTLDIVGTATAVRNAKFMLPTQVMDDGSGVGRLL